MSAITLLSALLTAFAAPCAAPATPITPDGELRTLYLNGQSWGDFMEAAVNRKELWDGNWARSADIDMSLVERARAVGGTWHLLAVAVDGCSDSVNTIPYMARLAELVEGLEIRIVDSDAGRTVMEDHPTPDGRASTPTVVLLNDDFEEVGCFIERPPVLRDWILENPMELGRQELYEAKMEWYADDSGQQTLEEVVRMLEAAAQGDTVCGD